MCVCVCYLEGTSRFSLHPRTSVCVVFEECVVDIERYIESAI